MTKYIQASSVKMLLHVRIEGQINLTAIQDQECRPLSCLAVAPREQKRNEQGWQKMAGGDSKWGEKGSTFSCVDGWSSPSPAWWQ